MQGVGLQFPQDGLNVFTVGEHGKHFELEGAAKERVRRLDEEIAEKRHEQLRAVFRHFHNGLRKIEKKYTRIKKQRSVTKKEKEKILVVKGNTNKKTWKL